MILCLNGMEMGFKTKSNEQRRTGWAGGGLRSAVQVHSLKGHAPVGGSLLAVNLPAAFRVLSVHLKCVVLGPTLNLLDQKT